MGLRVTAGLQPTVQQAFHPPLQVSADYEGPHLMCPVRALEAYVKRFSLEEDGPVISYQLFVLKQTISKWIVEALSTAYKARSLPSPLLLRAHSIKGIASPNALICVVSLQKVCNAAVPTATHTHFFLLS